MALDNFVHRQFGRARDVGRGSIWSVTSSDLGLRSLGAGGGVCVPVGGDRDARVKIESDDSQVDGGEALTGTVVTPSSGGMSCRMCGLTFRDTNEQQAHYKSSLHRTNLKRRMNGLPILKQETNASENVDEGSDSESDGSSEEDEDEDEDKEQGEEHAVEEADGHGDVRKKPSVVTTEDGTVNWGDYNSKDGVQVTFRGQGERGEKESAWQFSLNAVVLSSWHQISHKEDEDKDDIYKDPWNSLRASLSYFSRKPLMCVFILRSGRFSGVIFDGMTVLEHKTLRRYTVRAKAGGGQSSHDKQQGKAVSAGAMLRRYGEEALKEDVKRLLGLWKPHLDAAGVILFSIPKTMRGIMYEEGVDAPLKKGDKRVVNVPFMVRLPTFEEAQLIHARVSAVVFTRRNASSLTRASSKAHDSTSLATVPGAPLALDLGFALEELALENRTLSIARKEERKQAKLRRATRKEKESNFSEGLEQSEEEFAASAHPLSKELLSALAELVTAGKGHDKEQDLTDCVLAVVSKVANLSDNTEIASILRQPDSLRDMHSPLHLASECGSVVLVEALLMAGSDPGASDGHDRGPYLVARDKATRDTFRRCRGAIEARVAGEKESSGGSFGIWDWDAAGVGPALTDDIETARKEAQKEKEKERKKRAKQRKKEAAQVEAQKAADFALAQELQEKEAANEEERRKRDAGVCAQCGTSLHKVKVFALQDCKCCSAACVMTLRRGLAAEAAERRFAK